MQTYVDVTKEDIYVKDLEKLFLNSMFLFKYKKCNSFVVPPNILTSCTKCSRTTGALPAARKELVSYYLMIYWYIWQSEGAYSHFEYVLLVSLWIVWMAIHFLSLKLVLASVDLRTKTASLNWLKFMEVSCGHLMLISMVPLEDFF